MSASEEPVVESPPEPAQPEQPSEPVRPADDTAAEEAALLRSALEAARRRVDELARGLQALEREKEDFKKRLVRERERMIDVEKGNIAQTLLETVDELDLCLVSADDSAFAQGVRMIRDGILARLGALGVERVSLVGAPFDPNLAEAIDMEVTADPEEDHRVVQEVRPAYRMNERVIRPGRVKVARYIQPAEA